MDKYWKRTRFFFFSSLRCMGISLHCLWCIICKAIARHRFAVVTTIAIILFAMNILQFVSHRMNTKTLEYTNDSLQLSNDTLRTTSLYEEGYHDGLEKGANIKRPSND